METSMISEVTGYRVAVVNRWCSKGKLKHFVIKGRNLVPKIYLIDFLCSLDFRKISRKSDWHISSLQNYRCWKYLDSQQSKWVKDELSILDGSSFFRLSILFLSSMMKWYSKVSKSESQSVNLTLWDFSWHFWITYVCINKVVLHPLRVLFLSPHNQMQTHKS